MLDLIWDFYQARQIEDLKQRGREAGERVTGMQERVNELEQAVERLVGTTEALWVLVKERTGLTDDELIARVRQIENERRGGEVSRCPACGRVVPRGKMACIYCGEVVAKSAFGGM